MMKTQREVLDTLRENRARLQELGIRRLGLFGSVVRGDGSESSDLDFVAEFTTKSFDSYMGVKLFLEDLFGCKVDLVLKDAIKPSLRETILNGLVHAPGL